MASNISLASVVYLIFNHCKQPNSELVDADKIIEYIMNNFDYKNEEVVQLQFNDLFESLRAEAKHNRNLLSKDNFEKVFKIWIPSVENQYEQSINEPFHDSILFNSTQNRLSRSLTNLKIQTDTDPKYNYHKWCDWNEQISSNNENIFAEFIDEGNISPHDNPFEIPLDIVRSTPIKKHRFDSIDIGGLEQPDLRYIKPQRDFDQNSFSDTETLSRYEGSLFEDEFNENIDKEKVHKYRKRSRTNIIVQGDLLSQLRQIKFKNTQLVDINERLQNQLEIAEDNIRALNDKSMDLEKKNRHITDINEENKLLLIEVDDIRKRMDSELEVKRRIQSEKIMTESELVAAKEYIQSLIDKLSLLDSALEEKDRVISNMKLMIKQQEEFCIKLQEVNSEKDEELAKNQKGIRKLTDAICEYEEKIHMISRERDDLKVKYDSDIYRTDLENILEDDNDAKHQDRASGGKLAGVERFSTQSEFQTNFAHNAPWSIKLELATELIDSTGDSPLCEKLCFDEDLFNDNSDDSSFQMLSGLLSMINSLRMTLSQYREQLESASRTIQNNEHFSDEISLSYLSHLSESIRLLSVSTEKAASCQHQFSDTFNLLMKRISILRNEKKQMLLRNEKLLQQINESSNLSDPIVTDKLCFLNEELRKERLSCLEKDREIEKLKDFNQIILKSTKCSLCGKPGLQFENPYTMETRDLDALDLEDGLFLSKEHEMTKRRYTIGDISIKSKDNTVISSKRTRMLSTSLGDLTKINNNNECSNHNNLNMSSDGDIDQEIEMYRNYNISTENLAQIPRYKISRTHNDNIDIEGIIENSWLEPPSKFEERRASVFAQVDNDHNLPENLEVKNATNLSTINDFENVIVTLSRTRSSSCSSSNDTSDANSVDSHEERKKLAQQLEYRTLRIQSRSPATTLLNSSLVSDDLKILTPINTEPGQIHSIEDFFQSAEPYIFNDDSNFHEYSQNEKLEYHSLPTSNVDVNTVVENGSSDSPRERKQSIIVPTTMVTQFDSVSEDVQVTSKPDVPRISIIDPSLIELDRVSGFNPKAIDDSKSLKPSQTAVNENNNDLEVISTQSPTNKSNYSSCASSVIGEELRNSSNQNINLKQKRAKRPNSMGISIYSYKSVQDDSVSNYDDPSVNGDLSAIQEAIDMLAETSQSLELISSEDLENKYSETILMYRTDRPTVVDRALDANNKCNKALTNVEQEFNILRHLIKNMSMMVDQPCDLIPRMKTSINVLEKCVEYLSAKSEILGSVQQEIKLSCLADIMQQFNATLQKQRENHIRELEELRASTSILNEMTINNSFDQNRSKRSILAGKKLLSKVQHHERYSCLNATTSRKANVNKPLKELRLSFRRRSNSDSSLISRGDQQSHMVGSQYAKHLLIRSDTLDAFDHRDPKTRFQIVAQTTATKQSILRQLSNSAHRLGNQSALPDLSLTDSAKPESKLISSRSSSSQSFGLADLTRRVIDDENMKTRKIAVNKFFPGTPTMDDSGENLYQKGLVQGLKMNTDQALTDLRAQQSKFSSTLDALSDMIEENESVETDYSLLVQKDARISEMKNKILLFFWDLKTAIGRFVYIVVGVVVMIGLLLPWILIPANPTTTSFSVPVSRRRSYSFPDVSQDSDRADPSPSPSNLFVSNINVVRHNPAAV